MAEDNGKKTSTITKLSANIQQLSSNAVEEANRLRKAWNCEQEMQRKIEECFKQPRRALKDSDAHAKGVGRQLGDSNIRLEQAEAQLAALRAENKDHERLIIEKGKERCAQVLSSAQEIVSLQQNESSRNSIVQSFVLGMVAKLESWRVAIFASMRSLISTRSVQDVDGSQERAPLLEN